MERLLERIRSPEFWLEVVVIGILVNLVSDYFKEALDRLSPRLFAWLRERWKTFVNRLPALEPLDARWRIWALRQLLETVIPAIIIALVINAFLAQATQVSGQSMKPNLHDAQRVVVEKVTYRFFHSPRRGDIVMIGLPDQTEMLIKRVVGLPGETIEVRRGKVYIGGRELDEPWSVHGEGSNYGPQVIPSMHVFVMGDNRGASNDSRHIGPIHVDHIVGRAWLSYWPWGYVGLIR